MLEENTDNLTICDVTLREYGQNIPASCLNIFTSEIRVEIALGLIDAGFNNLEIFSCINPGVAPAMNMKDIQSIAHRLGRKEGVNTITLVPNQAGYRSFLELGLGPDGYNHTMGIFFSAVDAHNLANLGRTVKETIHDYRKIAQDAFAKNIRMVGYVSAAFGYLEMEKGVLVRAGIDEINDYASLLFDLGARAVTFSDLQGVANKEETGMILEKILDKRKGRDTERLGYHPHHVSGEAAIANSRVAYDLGIRRFDASLGGTGGCVTGAPGNQPTEMLVGVFHKSGIKTGINERKMILLSEMVQKRLFSKISFS